MSRNRVGGRYQTVWSGAAPTVPYAGDTVLIDWRGSEVQPVCLSAFGKAGAGYALLHPQLKIEYGFGDVTNTMFAEPVGEVTLPASWLTVEVVNRLDPAQGSAFYNYLNEWPELFAAGDNTIDITCGLVAGSLPLAMSGYNMHRRYDAKRNVATNSVPLPTECTAVRVMGDPAGLLYVNGSAVIQSVYLAGHVVRMATWDNARMRQMVVGAAVQGVTWGELRRFVWTTTGNVAAYADYFAIVAATR